MSSPVRQALEGYVAGRVKAERVVAAVATAFYGEGSSGQTAGLRPLVDVIERAAPGVVELAGTADRPGFDIRLAERPFPPQYEGELRRAAEGYLATDSGRATLETSRAHDTRPGLLVRILGAVRRLFG